MKKSAILLTYIFFITGCFYFSIGPQHSLNANTGNKKQELIEKLDDTTVILAKKRKDGNYSGYCGGVWVDDDTILTAYHCAEAGVLSEAEMIIMELFGLQLDQRAILKRKLEFSTNQQAGEGLRDRLIRPGSINIAEIAAVDKNRDLALLKIKDLRATGYTVSKISRRKIRKGEKMFVVGHPAGLPFSYSELIVAAPVRVITTVGGDEPIKTLQLSGPAWHGNSGGGAFNKKGQLVGICSFLIRGTSNMIFFIHQDEIHGFLRDNNIILGKSS